MTHHCRKNLGGQEDQFRIRLGRWGHRGTCSQIALGTWAKHKHHDQIISSRPFLALSNLFTCAAKILVDP